MHTIALSRTAILLFALLLACGGCSTVKPRNVAEAGPYQMRYEMKDGQEELLVTRGQQTLFTKKGESMAVYAQGRPFANFATLGKEGIVAAYMIHIRDAEGKDAYTLLDENVDGIFDRKIDYGTKMIYEWDGSKWVTKAGQ